jgi:hypothetical protein
MVIKQDKHVYRVLTLSLLLVLLNTKIFGQVLVEPNKKKALKININYNRVKSQSGFILGGLAPAFLINGKSSIHEVELNEVQIRKHDRLVYDTYKKQYDTTHIRMATIGVRYQLMRSLRPPDRKIIPQFGISGLLVFDREKTEPPTYLDYARTNKSLLLTTDLVVGIRYNVRGRLFMDILVPLQLLRFGYELRKYENPNVSSRFQRELGFYWDQFTFPGLHVRMGVGIKI